ncbi:MAG: hypothetical protein GX141_02715 [Armatimonadetes bacterium]|nr:hypothetical protein [Armatimonadota bacterium]
MPRFAVNCTLGKLIKWLRALGCDPVYVSDSEEDELVRIAPQNSIRLCCL